jgi:hypothetical protein
MSCTISVRLAPMALGPLSATLNIRSASATLGSANVSGMGTAPGTLSISADAPVNGDCGAALIGSTSSTVATYTVKNIGTSATGMPTVSVNDTAQFTASGCSVSALQPNDTCTVSVTFKPKQHGQQTTSVSVSATPGGTANATVTGFGQNAATFAITATAGFDFGTAARGSTTGTTLSFTATNQGDVTSPTLAATTLGGTNPTSFSVTSDGCSGKAVAAGSTCALSVKFTPQVSGTPSTTLQVRSSSAVLGTATVSGKATPVWVKETASFAFKPFNVVTGTDANLVFAAGAAGNFISRSAGTWVDQSISNGPDFGQMGASSANSLWAVTSAGIERSTSPGIWYYDSSANGPMTLINGITPVSQTSVWASYQFDNGTLQAPMPGSVIYHYANGAWTSQTLALGGAGQMWGTSDTDVYAWGTHMQNDGGSSYKVTVILHRDASGNWSQTFTGKTLGVTANGLIGYTSVFGFGSPATNLYATARGDTVYRGTSPTNWTPMADAPAEIVGPKLHCDSVWGASPANVYIACMTSVYMHDGTTWSKPLTDANASFWSVWGSGPNDVYAVGSDTAGTTGVIYHLY